jgi:putative inorganic carbon (HCO3(-)) transporter
MIHGRFDDNFGSYRGSIWRRAIEVLPKNPIFGTGPDTFYHALGSERQLESAKNYGHTHDRAHNIFLQIAVCMGIPALIAYLIFLGSIFIPAIKRAFERPILFVFGAAALSYVIQSFFSIEGPIVAPLLWVALGVMANEIWQSKIGCESIKI